MANVEIVKLEKNGCAPCMALSYAFNENADKLAELGATITNINVSHTPEAIDEYGIASVPVLVFKADGKEVKRIVGGVSIDEVFDVIETIIAE